jgi:hypothetical protein
MDGVAKLALETKLDDFGVGSVSRKPTYPIGHRRFARNPNPAPKAQVYPQMEFCSSLNVKLVYKGNASHDRSFSLCRAHLRT